MVVDMWKKVPDIIDDTKELLYLKWKVEQFLGYVLSWLVVAVFDNHSKEFNIILLQWCFSWLIT